MSEVSNDISQLHRVLRCIIESGSLIQNYADTDNELVDAGLMMPENDDENLFEDVAEDQLAEEDLADENLAEDQLAKEDLADEDLVEDQLEIIPSYQLAGLQEVENELIGVENSKEPIGRMTYRSQKVQPENMEH